MEVNRCENDGSCVETSTGHLPFVAWSGGNRVEALHHEKLYTLHPSLNFKEQHC